MTNSFSPNVSLGQSDLRVTPICLGTMTFGEQVGEPVAHAVLDRAIARGINFIDTAEMPWVREGSGMTAADIVASCNASLKRLQTDVIDLYQIHWPERHVPAFGSMVYDPKQERSVTPILEQLEAFAGLVKAGKV